MNMGNKLMSLNNNFDYVSMLKSKTGDSLYTKRMFHRLDRWEHGQHFKVW